MYKTTYINVKDFNEASALMEYMYDWDYVEREGSDCIRFDRGPVSVWLRDGSEPGIEGVMTKQMTKRFLKEIPGAEVEEI